MMPNKACRPLNSVSSPKSQVSSPSDESDKSCDLRLGTWDKNPVSCPESCSSLNLSFERCAQRAVICKLFCVCSRPASPGGHSSKTMTISEPKAACTSIEISGERNFLLPSICERNSTPSSVNLRRSVSEKTWNPPESVSKERFHVENL